MAKMSRMAANTIKRQEVYDEVFRMLEERGEEMLKTSDNTNMCFPAVNALGEEIYVKITVSIPKADYDGHNEAASYEIDAREKRERKEEQAKERERKSAEQQRKRAEREAKKKAEEEAKAEKIAKAAEAEQNEDEEE